MPIPFAPLAAAALAVGSVISSVINNRTNKKLAQEQNKYNYNLWKEQNQYNLPSEQVKRLKDAGINPNMYMSQVVSTNRADAAAPSANLANQESVLDSGTASSLGSSLMDYEVNQENAESNRITAEANAQNADTQRAAQQAEAAMINSNIEVNNENKKKIQSEVLNLGEQNKILKKNWEILDEQQKQAVIKTARDKIEKDLYEQYGEKQIAADIKLKLSQANLNVSQEKLNDVTRRLAPLYASVAQQQADAAMLNAESGFMNTQVNMAQYEVMAKKVDAEIQKMVSEGKLNEAEAQFFKMFTWEKLLGAAVTVGSFFIPGGAIGKVGKAVKYAGKAAKAAKVASKATKAQKAAGKAMAHPTGSFTPAGSRQMHATTVNPRM